MTNVNTSSHYVIKREEGVVRAIYGDESFHFNILDMRLDLVKHSPDGYEWGYSGSGPAQLSLALCASATGDDELALKVYQRFKKVLVAKIPRELTSWTITKDEVLDIVEALAGVTVKKRYIVSRREVHIQMVSVEAESKEEAIEKVAEGEGEMMDNTLEYSHSLDPEYWTVEEE